MKSILNDVLLRDVVIHYGHEIAARILCDIWMYTDTTYRIMRGDVVARDIGHGAFVYYVIEDYLVTNGSYQKFRVAKMPY